MLEGAEIIVYDEQGNAIEIPLSPTQLEAVCKILGLSIENGDVKCFSDEGLKKIMAKTIDKLQLVIE